MVEGSQWRRFGIKIQVVSDCRDLGAHLHAVANRSYGKTFTTRMLKTAKEAERLGKVKAPYLKKATIAKAKKTMPKTMYGCEVSPVDETVSRTLRISFVDVLTYIPP